MADAQASAEDRFEAAGSPTSCTSRLLLRLQGSCHSAFWVGPSMGGQIPQHGGCFLCLRSKPPRGETPLAWGLFCSRPGSEGLGLAWPGCSCEGPGRRESKAAVWAPLSSPGFKEVQTNSVPVPGGSSSSLLEAPDCSPPPPPASSWKASSASVPGAPQRGLDSWLCRRKGEALPG